MSDDPQDVAEAFDEDRIDDVDDFTGDHFGAGLPDYPPDRPLGVDTLGVAPGEQDAGGEPSGDEAGRLVDDVATVPDHEAQLVGEAVPETDLAAEEAAMHVEEEPPA